MNKICECIEKLKEIYFELKESDEKYNENYFIDVINSLSKCLNEKKRKFNEFNEKKNSYAKNNLLPVLEKLINDCDTFLLLLQGNLYLRKMDLIGILQANFIISKNFEKIIKFNKESGDKGFYLLIINFKLKFDNIFNILLETYFLNKKQNIIKMIMGNEEEDGKILKSIDQDEIIKLKKHSPQKEISSYIQKILFLDKQPLKFEKLLSENIEIDFFILYFQSKSNLVNNELMFTYTKGSIGIIKIFYKKINYTDKVIIEEIEKYIEQGGFKKCPSLSSRDTPTITQKGEASNTNLPIISGNAMRKINVQGKGNNYIIFAKLSNSISVSIRYKENNSNDFEIIKSICRNFGDNFSQWPLLKTLAL